MATVPADYPVKMLRTAKQVQEATDPVACWSCGRAWDDGIVTGMTPAPSARCPFEYFHDGRLRKGVRLVLGIA